MHRNYLTDIHKLIIHPAKLENYQDSVNSIKNMFELGLGTTCYPENDLPEGLVKRIKTMKKIKNLDKLD
jgi:hypothetical protein